MAYLIYYQPQQSAENFGYYLCSDFAMTPIDTAALSEITPLLAAKYVTVHEAGLGALKAHMADNAKAVSRA